MPLSKGFLLSLTTDELKSFRKVKGDPARRAAIEKRIKAGGDVLALDVAASFIEFLARPRERLFLGKPLHRGQFFRIEHLERKELEAGLADLPASPNELEAAFLAIDEEAWRYRYLPFWVRNEWTAAGRTTILDAEHAAVVARVVLELRAFVAASAGRELVSFSD